MDFGQGMRRLAVFAGVLGAVAGAFYAHKVLRNVPSERYQHEVFESLMSSPIVKQAQARMVSLKSSGIEIPGTTDVNDERVSAIYWKEDCSVDFFSMQDGGVLESGPSPSAWLYLLWIVYPSLGFLIPWLAIRGIRWVVVGFVPTLN